MAELCAFCSEEIHSKGIFKLHSIFESNSLSDRKEDWCATHQKTLEFFCTDDWVGLCEDCTHFHKNHAVLLLEEALNDMFFEMDSKESKIQSIGHQATQILTNLKSLQTQIEKNSEYALQALRQQFGAVRQVLKSR